MDLTLHGRPPSSCQVKFTPAAVHLRRDGRLPRAPALPRPQMGRGQALAGPEARAHLGARTPDRRLVEPFCGGLAVALGLGPARALLNDANPHLVNFYRWIKRGLVIDLPMAERTRVVLPASTAASTGCCAVGQGPARARRRRSSTF